MNFSSGFRPSSRSGIGASRNSEQRGCPECTARLTLIQYACRVYFSGIRSRRRTEPKAPLRVWHRRQRRASARHNGATMSLGMEQSGTSASTTTTTATRPTTATTATMDFVLSASGTTACHASYRILITRVTRTAVPTYADGQPPCSPVVRHGPLWPWKTDHRSTALRSPGYLHVENGWLH